MTTVSAAKFCNTVNLIPYSIECRVTTITITPRQPPTLTKTCSWIVSACRGHSVREYNTSMKNNFYITFPLVSPVPDLVCLLDLD